MNSLKSQKFTLVWLVLIIPLLSYLFLKKTFNLALYGDDWLQLYNLWLSFDIHKTLSFFDIKSYLGAYMPQYFFLGIIRQFFGYDAQAYFAASLFLRILSTISLFFFVKYLTKSQLAALLSSLIVTIAVAGLQTTDWVFNMNTYAGIFFLNLAMIFYIKTRATQTLISWNYLFFITLFTLALGVVPVRMHGAVPFVIFTELFLYIFQDRKNPLKKLDFFLIARLIIPIILMFILMQVGSFGSSGDITPALKESFIYVQNALHQGKYDILFYFLGIIGNILVPDTLHWENGFNYVTIRSLFMLGLGLLITFAINGGKNIYLGVIIANILWGVMNKLFITWNPSLSLANLFSISFGFQFLLLSFLVFFSAYKTYPKLAITIIIGVFWIIFFSLLYWLRTPYLIIESTGRYMTMGAIGFSMVFASILSIMFLNYKNVLKMKAGFFIIAAFLLGGWLYINFSQSQLYLTNLETNRNLALAEKTWTTLKKIVPNLDKDSPSVFYFTYDSATAANMILIFGFWPHAGLSYQISDWEKTPLPTEDYKQLEEMVKTGKPLNKVHARKAIPVPLSKVFSFDLRNGELISTTDIVRAQLAKSLNEATQ